MRDRFVEERLPPPDQLPEFRFDLPALQYPERMNAAVELLEGGAPDALAIVNAHGRWTYADLHQRGAEIEPGLFEIRLGRQHGTQVGDSPLDVIEAAARHARGSHTVKQDPTPIWLARSRRCAGRPTRCTTARSSVSTRPSSTSSSGRTTSSRSATARRLRCLAYAVTSKLVYRASSGFSGGQLGGG